MKPNTVIVSTKVTLIASGLGFGAMAKGNPLDVWNWRSPGPPNVRLQAVTFGDGQFVAVGGGIASSPHGVNWIQHSQPYSYHPYLQTVHFGNGHFVVAGTGGAILESGPITRLDLKPSTGNGLPTFSLTGPFGLAYTIQRSSDIASWQSITNLTPVQQNTVVLDGLGPTTERAFYRALTQ